MYYAQSPIFRACLKGVIITKIKLLHSCVDYRAPL